MVYEPDDFDEVDKGVKYVFTVEVYDDVELRDWKLIKVSHGYLNGAQHKACLNLQQTWLKKGWPFDKIRMEKSPLPVENKNNI